MPQFKKTSLYAVKYPVYWILLAIGDCKVTKQNAISKWILAGWGELLPADDRLHRHQDGGQDGVPAGAALLLREDRPAPHCGPGVSSQWTSCTSSD